MRGVTPPDSVALRRRDDLMWAVRPDSDDRVGPGPHEDGVQAVLRRFVSPDTTFVDVGAHVGHHSLRLARHCARVIAIEPNPPASRALRTNIGLNGLTNIAVYGVAAHHRSERLRLWDPFTRTGGSCTRTLCAGEVSPPPAGYPRSTMVVGPGGIGRDLGSVRALPIDSVTATESGRISLLKIDVEGSEARVLTGARRTLERHRPALVVEMHHGMYGMEIWADVLHQLGSSGYAWEPLPLSAGPTPTGPDGCEYILAQPAGRGQ